MARRLVVSVGVFWAAWGCAVVAAETSQSGAIIAISGVVGLVALTFFYATLFHAFSLPMYSWSFREQGARWQVMLNLLNPAWLWQTLKSTEWPAFIIAVGLGILLATDLVLFGILTAHPPPKQ